MALKMQRELEMKLHDEFYKTVYILTLHYPPSEAFVQVFKKGLFIKNNKTGSQQIIYYLLEILDKANLKQLIKTWPLHDVRSEFEFRKEILKYINELNSLYEDADIPNLTTSHLISPGGFKFIKFMFKLSMFVLYLHIQRNPDIYPNMLLPLKPSKKEVVTKQNIERLTNATNTINKSTMILKANFESTHEDAMKESLMLEEQYNEITDVVEELKIKLDILKEQVSSMDDNNVEREELLNKLETLKSLKEKFQHSQLLCSRLENPLTLKFDKKCDIKDPLNIIQIEDDNLDLINLLKSFNALTATKYMEVKPVNKDNLKKEVHRFSRLNERIEIMLKEMKIISKEALELSEKLEKESLGKTSFDGKFRRMLYSDTELAQPLSDSI